MLFAKVLSLSALLVLLTACGSIANSTSVEKLKPGALAAPDKGVVVFSAGAPERCVSFSTNLILGDRVSKKAVNPGPYLAVDAYVHKSEFSDHHGTLNALQLSPGAYMFTPYIMNPYVKTVVAPTFEFEVAAGELTYLGELFMTASCGMNTSFVVRDYYERDMPLASARNPEFQGRVAVKRLLKSGPPTQ